MYTGPQPGHDDRPTRATPTRIAASLAEGTILRTCRRERAFPSTAPKRFNSEECFRECVLCEWFLRDLVISVESGRHRATIRRALVERLRLDLERSGLSPEWLLQLDRLHLSRFSEYSHSASRRTRRRYYVDTMNVESIQAAPARQTSAYRSRSLDGARPSPGSSSEMLSPRLAVITQA